MKQHKFGQCSQTQDGILMVSVQDQELDLIPVDPPNSGLFCDFDRGRKTNLHPDTPKHQWISKGFDHSQQTSHFPGVFPWLHPYLCVFSWALQAAGSEKALLHSLHEKGFSPVWIRMCRLKFPVWVNSFPQS